jgi:hypothetical protein
MHCKLVHGLVAQMEMAYGTKNKTSSESKPVRERELTDSERLDGEKFSERCADSERRH